MSDPTRRFVDQTQFTPQLFCPRSQDLRRTDERREEQSEGGEDFEPSDDLDRPGAELLGPSGNAAASAPATIHKPLRQRSYAAR